MINDVTIDVFSIKSKRNVYYITNIACNELIMKFMQSSFIHKFVYFTQKYHVLKTHLTHG
jgi:hypothetical protein